MRKSFLVTISLAMLAACVLGATARADGARVQVATIDGAPVYRWLAFKSFLSDDVDRALLVRKFNRKGFKLPDKLIDAAVKQQVADQFGGNEGKFARHLRAEGATPADFRAFVTEEIIVDAMLYSEAKTPAARAQEQADLLTKLRAGAVVKRSSAKGETGGG